jgi:hypothetical protein
MKIEDVCSRVKVVNSARKTPILSTVIEQIF